MLPRDQNSVDRIRAHLCATGARRRPEAATDMSGDNARQSRPAMPHRDSLNILRVADDPLEALGQATSAHRALCGTVESFRSSSDRTPDRRSPLGVTLRYLFAT